MSELDQRLSDARSDLDRLAAPPLDLPGLKLIAKRRTLHRKIGTTLASLALLGGAAGIANSMLDPHQGEQRISVVGDADPDAEIGPALEASYERSERGEPMLRLRAVGDPHERRWFDGSIVLIEVGPSSERRLGRIYIDDMYHGVGHLDTGEGIGYPGPREILDAADVQHHLTSLPPLSPGTYRAEIHLSTLDNEQTWTQAETIADKFVVTVLD